MSIGIELNINPSRPDPEGGEKIKNHTSSWCLKRFYKDLKKAFIKPFEAHQRSMKIKIPVSFFRKKQAGRLGIQNKLCVSVALYRSLNRSNNEFPSFVTNFESIQKAITLRKHSSIMVLGDFNAKK